MPIIRNSKICRIMLKWDLYPIFTPMIILFLLQGPYRPYLKGLHLLKTFWYSSKECTILYLGYTLIAFVTFNHIRSFFKETFRLLFFLSWLKFELSFTIQCINVSVSINFHLTSDSILIRSVSFKIKSQSDILILAPFYAFDGLHF